MKKIAAIFCLLVISVSGAFANSAEMQVEMLLIDSASGLASATSIRFMANTSPLYYPSEDVSITIDTTSTTPQLCSFSLDNFACSSNSYGPLNSTTIVRLGVGISTGGTYVISAQQFLGFDQASMIFLEDRVTHIFTDLRQWGYTVSLPQSGEISDRFYLHVTYPPVVTSSPAGCANNNGAVIVTEDSSVEWQKVQVFDSAGALILVDTGVTGNFNFIGLPAGNYTLEFDYSVYAPLFSVTVVGHQLVQTMNVASDHGYVGENIQFNTSTSNANEWVWNFGDGSIITGDANPIYSYLGPGVFHVTVNSSNAYGCSSQSDTTMYIDVASSIENIDGNTVQILNDGKNVLIELDNTTGAGYIYKAYNIEGQVIKTGPLNSGNQEISFNNDASGIYVITITGNTSSISKKVLITH